MRRSTALLSAALAGGALFALAGAQARAGVDAATGPKASVRGTIMPSGETEVFRFDAPAGAKVSLTAASKRKGALDLSLALEAPSGAAVALEGAGTFRDTGSKVSVQRLTLSESGVYTLRLSAAGTGEYTLALTVTPRTKFAASATVPAAGSVQVPFAAPAGARLALVAKAPKKSLARPRFGFFGTEDLSTLGRIGTKSHTVNVGAVWGTTDYEVEVRNVGAADGPVDASVVVIPAKAKTRTLDVRGIDGSATAVVRVIVAAQGALIDVGGAPGPLAGCVLAIPGGALARDTAITIRSLLAAEVADPLTQQPAGPAATFGPPGTTFATPVTIRLPYDPSAFPRGSDPAADLRVVRREANGTATTLTPTAVVTAESFCEFETDGFSEFLPVAPVGPPTLGGRSYWTARLAHVYEDSATDTRGREFRLRLGAVHLLPAKSFVFDGEEHVVAIDHVGSQAGQIVGDVRSSTAPVTAIGPWAYVPGVPEDVTFAGDELAMSQDGRVLCGSVVTGFDLAPDLHLFTQKPAFPLVRADVAGTYWVARLAVTPTAVAGRPADVTFARLFGSLELRADGTCRFVRDEVSWHYDRAKGYDVQTTAHLTHTGTFSMTGAGGGVFEGAIEAHAGPYDWRLLPDHDSRVLVGTDVPQGSASVIVGVRRSTALPFDALAGTYATYELSAQTSGAEYSIDGEFVPDWITFNRHATWRLAGDGVFDYLPPGGAAVGRYFTGGVYVSISGPGTLLQLATLAPETSGFYRALPFQQFDDVNRMGAFSPDGSFGFGTNDPESANDNLLQMLVRTAR